MTELERLSAAALRLRADDAFKAVVRHIGTGLEKEILAHGPTAERGAQAWQEYNALKRLTAGIDQLAQDASRKEKEADGA